MPDISAKFIPINLTKRLRSKFSKANSYLFSMLKENAAVGFKRQDFQI
jgi:hypothetical protein